MKRRKKYNTNTLDRFIKKEFKTKEKLPFKTTKVFYPKNSTIITPGIIESNIYFVSQGIVQASLISMDNKEIIFDFYSNNQMVSAISSYIKQVPTDFTLLCLTDCIIEVVPITSIISHLENSMLVNRFYRFYFQTTYVLRLKREKSKLTKTPTEQYLEMIREEPELAKQLPINTIAKYLGIHPFSLSRLRRKIIKQ